MTDVHDKNVEKFLSFLDNPDSEQDSETESEEQGLNIESEGESVVTVAGSAGELRQLVEFLNSQLNFRLDEEQIGSYLSGEQSELVCTVQPYRMYINSKAGKPYQITFTVNAMQDREEFAKKLKREIRSLV